MKWEFPLALLVAIMECDVSNENNGPGFKASRLLLRGHYELQGRNNASEPG
jgi:hypothetical protein